MPSYIRDSSLCLLSLLLLVAAAASCRRHVSDGFSEMKWETLGERGDSLNLLLERRFYDAAPGDTIRRDIESLAQTRAEPSDANSLRRRDARVAFWKARLAKRMSDDEVAAMHLANAFALNDSVADRYTYHRLRTLGESDEADSVTLRMSRLMEDLDYYRRVRDPMMEGATSILIAHALANSYQLDFALEYLSLADSIHRMLGLEKYVAKNRINICSALYKSGDKEKGDSLMAIMLEDPLIREDSMAYNTLLQNCYIFNRDFGKLKEGAAQMARMDSASPRNAVYDILLGRHYRENGNLKEGARHTRRAFSRIEKIQDQELRCEILSEMVIDLREQGLRDSAALLQDRYIEEFRMQTELRQPREMAHLRNVQIVTRHKMESASARNHYLVRLLILSIILVVVGCAALLLLIKARQRHRLQEQRIMLDQVQSQLETEEYRRQYMALTIAMEETDRHLEQIKEQIETLNKEGKVSHTEMTRVRQVLQQHASNRDEWKQFNELFGKAHPKFEKNLNERYPDLSEGQRKMAIYIYTGMSNKQMAQFLNVRPESIKQARWRLRVKMGLTADESLEDALRALA